MKFKFILERDFANSFNILKRDNRTTVKIMCVFNKNEFRFARVCCFLSYRGLYIIRIHRAAFTEYSSYVKAPYPGTAAAFEIKDMTERFGNYLTAAGAMYTHREKVSHYAAGDVQAGFFPHLFSRQLFQFFHCGIGAVNIITDLAFDHCFIHCLGRACNGVATEVEYLFSHWKFPD